MDIYTAPSHIQGIGCFAGRAFKKGETIAEYTGERITEEEADRRYPEMDATYLFVTADRTVIDATHDENPVKYINHCCDPNCESVEEDGCIFIKALRDIAKDEELHYDYNLESDEEDPCFCGAANCRGTMRGE